MAAPSNAFVAKIKKQYGLYASKRIKSWQQLIKNNQNKTLQQKLNLVNGFFNRLQYQPDIALVGKTDYWMTPVEFLVKASGDCEDFSIAKYFTLKALGVKDSHLQLVYVKSLQYNRAHMILAYYPTPEADPLILDNLTNKILPASKRPDLVPVYSFNAQGLWLAKKRGLGQKVGGSDRLSAWMKVLTRMKKYFKE